MQLLNVRADDDQNIEDVRRRIARNPAQVVLLALQGSRLHARVLAASLGAIPRIFYPAVIDMFANSIRHHGTHIAYDNEGYLAVGDMDIAILAISQIKSDFYTANPASRQRVFNSLPHLYSWTKVAMEWLVQKHEGPERLMELRGYLLDIIHSAIAVMREVGEDGVMFIWEKDAHHLIIDLWVQLRGCTIKEEAKAACTLMICKSTFFEGAADGTLRHAPENFGEYLLERCRSQFDLDTARIVALAKDRVVRASSPPTAVIEPDSHLYVEVELEVLGAIIATPGSAHQYFVDEGGIHTLMLIMASGVKGDLWGIVGNSLIVLEKICDRTQSTQAVLAALKNDLVEKLITGTYNYQHFEYVAAESLLAFIERILPDALLFRSNFDRCDALTAGDERREVLCSDPRVGGQWTHLFRVYDERKTFFDKVLRHQLRECDHINCSVKETQYCQFPKCGGCEMRFFCSKKCQREAWVQHRGECYKMRDVRHDGLCSSRDKEPDPTRTP
ncbi:hypothetical protein SCHPADRAFT_947982 [Schizopora paradoxa]|uniref:MYND-type domain-containing protein n=1 Tax=Schizopora paradoxa TaxID=27342 RepID=A0A0H2QX03_9AGAM|nr:hypothetical protein SCHPADRAFT_947982 [Schizopora paradoxa]